MRWLVFVLVATGCDAVFGLGPVDPPADAPAGMLAGYHARKRITLAVGEGPNLPDFPVSIAINADSDLSIADPTGSDLVFTGSDGLTILDREIVRFAAGTGELDAWMRVPVLQPGHDVFYLYYGGPAQVSPPSSTWSSAYAGVWHMSQAGLVEQDSTTHGHHVAAGSSTTMPASVAGVAGSARMFDGVNDEICTVAAGDSSLDFGTSSVAVTVWVNVTASATTYDAPFYRGGTNVGDPGIALELGTGSWEASIVDADKDLVAPITTETLMKWTQIGVIVDRKLNKARAVLDGKLGTDTDLLTLGSLRTTRPTCFGSEIGNTYLHGIIDEARVYAEEAPDDLPNTVRAIEIEYENFARRSTFVTVDPEERLF